MERLQLTLEDDGSATVKYEGSYRYLKRNGFDVEETIDLWLEDSGKRGEEFDSNLRAIVAVFFNSWIKRLSREYGIPLISVDGEDRSGDDGEAVGSSGEVPVRHGLQPEGLEYDPIPDEEGSREDEQDLRGNEEGREGAQA